MAHQGTGSLRRAASGLLLAVLVTGLAELLGASPVGRVAELHTYDLRLAAFPNHLPPKAVAVVEITPGAAAALGEKVPLRRATVARLVRRLSDAGAAVIALDLVFSGQTADRPEDDRELAQALAQAGNVVLARMADNSGGQPLPLIARSAARVAAPLAPADLDNVVRRVALVVPGRDAPEPSFLTAAAALYLGVEPSTGGQVNARRLRLGPLTVPTDGRGMMLVRYTAAGRPMPSYPVDQVLNDDLSDALADRIVLVGAGADSLEDQHPVPRALRLGAFVSGTHIQAHAMQTLLSRHFLRPGPPWCGWALALLGSLLGLLAAGGGAGWRQGLGVVAALVAMAVLAFSAFGGAGLWLPWAVPSAAVGLGWAVGTARRAASAAAERHRVEGLFGRYVHPAVVKAILAGADAAGAGGERRHVTVMFADMRGFTTWSESLAPERVVGLLNEYFEIAEEVVFRHGGMVDKYIGDEIMAIFGAPLEQPDHAAAALAAARELVQATGAFAASAPERSHVGIRISLHTGDVTMGNLGSRRRRDFTVVGDAVNVSARLQGVAKERGLLILMSESTFHDAGEPEDAVAVGEVALRGRSAGLVAYALQQAAPTNAEGTESRGAK